MGAWNLPPAMHRLSYLVGFVAVTSGGLSYFYGSRWPLAATLALAYTAVAAIVLAAAASTRRNARACVHLFFKDPKTGRIPLLALALWWPYHLTVQIICFFYRQSSRESIFDKITDRLYLGGWPLRKSMLPSPSCAILDCTCELLPVVKAGSYKPLLVFESWAPEPEAMSAGVKWALEQQAAGRDVFVHCTHGHGRSAVEAAAILMSMGQAASVDEALAKVKKARPGVQPNARQVNLLREWAALQGKDKPAS